MENCMSDKASAKKDVLKKLIEMAQEMMMEGMGDSEEAGNRISEAMQDGSAVAEGESAEVDGDVSLEGEDDDFDDYRKAEMKKGLRSPIKDRKVAIMVAGRPRAGKGRV